MTITRARTVQYIGILFSLMLIAVGYWYFSVRAGVKTNTSASQPQGTGQLDSGLSAYWKLDENTGTSATDSSTNGNTGTLTNGPTWSTGQIGSAVTFDGTNDEITSTNNQGTAANLKTLTLSVWFKSSTASGKKLIGMEDVQTGTGAANTDRQIWMGTDGKIRFAVYASALKEVASVATLNDNTWHHAVGVSTGDNGTLYLYIDGALQGSTSVGGTIFTYSNSYWRIGGYENSGWTNGADGYFTGQMDEVRVYDRPLSTDEVGQLYRLTTPTSTDTYLNGYWSFNAQDMSGTTAYDRSGAGNTGTLTGGPTGGSGIIGQALNFDGTDDYVTVPDNAALDVPSNFVTLSGWFNRDTATTDDVIVAKRSGIAAANTGYIVYLDATTDKLVFEMSDGTDEYSMTSTTAFTTPGWHHFAITYEDDVDLTTQIYIDGLANQPSKSGTLTNIGDITNALAFVVGAESDAGSPFDGKIDEIRMYQGIVLQAARIKTLYDQAQPDEQNTSGVQAAGAGRLESGLTAYWALDDGTSGASPTTAADSSTNALTAGTLTNGPVWAAGQIGSSVDFDGTDDYIAVADTPLLDFGDTDDFTLSGWFNRESYTTDDVLVAKRTTLLAGANGYVAYLDDATDQIIFEVSDGTDEYSLTSTSTFTLGAKEGWRHFVIVWDQDSPAQSEIYIDGIADNATDSGTIGNVGDLSNAVQFGIGVNSLAGDDYDGKIDEVRVYSRALAPDEIVQLYRLATPTGVDTGLKGYWSFNSEATPGTIAFDWSGARNTGTLTGGPIATVGKLGQALSFNGTSQYVSVPYAGIDFERTDSFTLSAWAKWEDFSPTGGAQGIMGRLTTGGASRGTALIRCKNAVGGICNAGSVGFGLWGGVSGAHLIVSTPTNSTVPNVWTHVVVTYDGSSSTSGVKIYKDGVNQTLTTHDNDLATTIKPNINWRIGDDATSDYAKGPIDEVRIYNRVLSAAEIKAQYDLSASDKTNTSASQPQGTGNLDSGLAAYWKLDENTGTSAADSSTNAIAAFTLTNGPTWTTGQIGSGIDFDGTNDYATMADADILDLDDTDDMTISGWFYRDTFTTNDGIVFKRNGIFNTNAGYSVYIDSTTDQLILEVCDNADEYSLASTATFTATGWNHFVAVWDQDSPQNSELYINGKADNATDTGTIGNIGTLANAHLVAIGAESDGDNSFFDGKLDEIRIYDRTLSPDEIAQLYRASTPTGTDTSLKGYWSFNGQDVNSTTALDRSGAGNNGTLTNSPTKTIGKLGQALSFSSGSSQYVDMGDINSLDGATAVTLMGWFKRATGSSDVLTVGKCSTQASYVCLNFYNDGKVYVNIGDGTASRYGYAASGDTDWHNAALVYDGTLSGNANRLKLYLDGVLQTLTFSGTIPAITENTSDTFRVGRNAGIAPEYSNGKIDEVRVYNRAFTAAEVVSLYNQSK